MSSPSSNCKWISFLAENLLEVEESQAFQALQWCTGQEALPDQGDCSGEYDGSKVDSDEHEKPSDRKRRAREYACAGAGNKACREKARRDRLNDRFLELSSAVEPDRPPKSDKAAILSDALRMVTQLRTETNELKLSNHQLRDAIKDLKTEKNELRDEKLRLKADKEKLEQQLKAIMIPSGYLAHPAALHAAVSGYAVQAQAANKAQLARYPPIAMWEWMPPSVLDTSQDHLLRPPVA